MKSMCRRRRGQGLVEYGMIICGVALVAAVAVSEFGHKTSDLIAAVAVVLPGAHNGDNAPMVSGHLIEATLQGNAGNLSMGLDTGSILNNSNQDRMGENLFGNNSAGSAYGLGGLVIESR
ncbi:MAG TPA: hypothetical protein VFF73_26645 [Planctomycetota bacterium]|nr:hypothetical protein [Planctomycetota bacterium]